MSHVAIQAEGLGKNYKLGLSAAYGSLRESLSKGTSRALSRVTGKSPRGEVDLLWALSLIHI